MANKIGLEAVLEMAGFNKGMKEYSSGISDMEGKTEKAGGKLSKLGGVIGGVGKVALGIGAAGVTALAGGMAAYVIDATKAAAETEGVRNTFDMLTESIGGTSEAFLIQLHDATRGMVKDSDLMQAANKFMAMGLADNTEEAAKLSEMATQLGMAMGEDATSSMENFALMLANQSIPRLDSFGISSGKVRERIEELMKADESLTREQAFMTAVMEQGTATMEKVGEQGDTTAANMARVDATMANIKETIGRAFLPIWNQLLGKFSEFLSEHGPEIQAVFQAIADFVINELIPGIGQLVDWIKGNLIPAFQTIVSWFRGEGSGSMISFVQKILTVLGPAIEFARGIFQGLVTWVQENWPLIQATVQTVMEAINTVITTVLGAIQTFWDAHGEQIMTIVNNVWTIIKTVIETVIKTILSIIRAVMLIIQGDWEGAWEEVKAAAERIWEAIKTILAAAWENIRTMLSIAWEGIVSVFDNVWDKFKEIGTNIIEGIKQGIEGAWESFKGWIQEKMNMLPQWLKDFMGIGSPAKVMLPIGQSLVEGMRAGWDKGLGDFRAQMQTQVQAAMPSVQLPAMASPSGAGSTVTNTTTNHSWNVTAHYARQQSESSIRQDLSMWTGIMRAGVRA